MTVMKSIALVSIGSVLGLLISGCGGSGTGRNHPGLLRQRIQQFGMPDLVEESAGDTSVAYRPWRVQPAPSPYAEHRFYYLKGRRLVVFCPRGAPQNVTDG